MVPTLPRVEGIERQAGISNYFTAPESSQWVRRVPHFAGVRMHDVYRGTDLVYHGSGSRFEYDFVLKPHADPKAIRFQLEGARLESNGDLLVRTEGGELRQHKPVAYQMMHGKRRQVECAFALRDGEVTFALGRYDKSRELVIDPTIVFSTYAGNQFGWNYGIAVDTSGASYSVGRFTRVINGASLNAGLVMKLNPAGNAIVYLNYFGDVEPRGIALNAAGAAYVTGFAGTDRLATKNAYQNSTNGETDAFLTKINPAGDDLEFSTYFGGSGRETGVRVQLDGAGGIHMLLRTTSADLPLRSAFRTTFAGGEDLALVKFNETANNLIFSTYLGTGTGLVTLNSFGGELGSSGLAVDNAGNVIVSGFGAPANLLNAILGAPSGRFLMRLSPIGAVVQSTYLPAGGGPVAVDATGTIFIGGKTTNLVPQQTGNEAAVCKFVPSTGDFSILANLGPSVVIYSLALDSASNVYVAGGAIGSSLPLMRPIQAWTGGLDAVLAKVSSNGTIVYSTYYGGENADEAYGVAVDATGAAYLAGYTGSVGLPLANALYSTKSSFQDGFIAKIADTSDSTIVPVQITTSPVTSGGSSLRLEVIVDGVRQVAPVNVNWLVGSTHTISAPLTQGDANLRYRFQSWNTGSAITQALTIAGAANLVATFTAEVKVNVDVFPAGSGTLSVNPTSTDGFYPVSSTITLTPTAAAGHTFIGWTGSISSSIALLAYVVPNSAPVTLLANFSTSSTAGGGGLEFVPITPCRVLDTRNGTKLTGGVSRDVNIPQGPCGIPATARAYSLTATVVPSGALAYLTLYPAGQPRPEVSTLNAFEGQIIANAAIVPAGTNGAITAFALNDTQLILDVNGYFTDTFSAQSLQFYPVTPCRVVDTRVASGGPGGALGPPALVAGIARSFPLPQSNCGLPATAKAYALNVTVVPPGPLDYITVFPTGVNLPLASNQNSPQGRVLATMAIVPAGTDGAVSLYAPQSTDAVVDVTGYFAPASAGIANGLRFYPVSPCRLADTRTSSAIPIQTSREFPVSGLCGIGTGVGKAYSLNATVLPSGYLGFVTLFPGPTSPPFASTLNAWEGQIAANAAIVPASATGSVSAYVSNATGLILDINGYFAP